jgi:hypothetical protein
LLSIPRKIELVRFLFREDMGSASYRSLGKFLGVGDNTVFRLFKSQANMRKGTLEKIKANCPPLVARGTTAHSLVNWWLETQRDEGPLTPEEFNESRYAGYARRGPNLGAPNPPEPEPSEPEPSEPKPPRRLSDMPGKETLAKSRAVMNARHNANAIEARNRLLVVMQRGPAMTGDPEDFVTLASALVVLLKLTNGDANA